MQTQLPSPMHVLVTGATGFLGKALCDALEHQGHSVVRLGSRDCDLRDARALDRFAEPKFERIFHLAAWTQAGDFCLHHPGEQWVINQQINTNVLAWWHTLQPQAKLIAIGTSCAYDEHLPLREDNYFAGEPTPSLFTYAMTKRMLYAGLLALHRQFGLRFLHVVPSTLYGPDYHEDGRQMHFVFDLIRKILAGRFRGERVVLWGDGDQRRELVYRDDFIRVLLWLADHVENETINIGAGYDETIRGFARRICAVVGYPFERIEFDTTRYVGARSKCLDVSKLRKVLPDWQGGTPLDEGLRRTIAWMQEREMY